jgi:YjbE family integral membrane protein
MMGFDSGMHSLGLTLQVFFLDLLLSGDNAIVIALACRRLPAQQMRQAIMVGTGVAIFLRVLFTTIVAFLLAIPLLKLLGMVALIWIAIKLLVEEDSDLEDSQSDAAGGASSAPSLWATIGIIVVADITMSLDNVVALAAISQNSVFFLLLGLALSVPLLMYGSLFVTTLLKRYPILIPAGGALLGWIAGDIGMSDPLIADWVSAQLPGLTLAVPLACAIFVLLESKIIQENLRRFPKPEPVVCVSKREEMFQTTNLPAADAQPELLAKQVTDSLAIESESEILPVAIAVEGKMDIVEAVSEVRISRQPVPAKWNFTLPSVFPRKGVLYFLIALLGLPVPVVIGSIIYKSVANKGLMPQPTPLMQYECPGSQGSFYFYFRHGIETVKIQSSSGLLQGTAHYGKINWSNFSGDTAVLGFTPPQEITWEDAKSIRLNGGSFLQINCAKKMDKAAVSINKSSTQP